MAHEPHDPDESHFSVASYVDARLRQADEHFQRLLDIAVEKIREEAQRTRIWIIFLTAPVWATLIADNDPHHKLLVASITLAVASLAALAWLVWPRLLRWYRRIRASR